jgi:hypothetical protein
LVDWDSDRSSRLARPPTRGRVARGRADLDREEVALMKQGIQGWTSYRRAALAAALLCTSAFAASCATTQFTSQPAGAEVRLERYPGYVGTTPFKMHLTDDGFTKVVRCVKTGYKTVDLRTNPARAAHVHCILQPLNSSESSDIEIQWREP